MAKYLIPSVLDQALAVLAQRAELLCLCAGAPGDAEDAAALPARGGRMLARRSLRPGLGAGDFSLAPGCRSGRRLVLAEQTGLEPVAEGRADHLALLTGDGAALLCLTPLAQPHWLKTGCRIALAAVSIEIADPS